MAAATPNLIHRLFIQHFTNTELKGTLYTYVRQLHLVAFVALTEIPAYIAILVQNVQIGSLTTGQIVEWFMFRLATNRDKLVTCKYFTELT